jgi:hypothetical protein
MDLSLIEMLKAETYQGIAKYAIAINKSDASSNPRLKSPD